jgi:hypothetical protein
MEIGMAFKLYKLFAISKLILEENLSNCKEFGQKRGLSPSKIFASALSPQTFTNES